MVVHHRPIHHQARHQTSAPGGHGQVAVLEVGRGVAGVEPAQGREHVAPHHPARGRGVVHVTSEHHRVVAVGPVRTAHGLGTAVGEDRLTGLGQPPLAVQQRRRRDGHRRILEGAQQRAQPPLGDDQIGVHERHELGIAFRDRQVVGRPEPQVLVQPDVSHTIGELPDVLAAPLGVGLADHDDVGRHVTGVTLERLDQSRQRRRGAVGDGDAGDEGQLSPPASHHGCR